MKRAITAGILAMGIALAGAPAANAGILYWTGTSVVERGAWSQYEQGSSVRFQTDGNLVHYKNGRATWSSNTAGRGTHLAFQNDGNIVVYGINGNAVWASHTANTGDIITKNSNVSVDKWTVTSIGQSGIKRLTTN